MTPASFHPAHLDEQSVLDWLAGRVTPARRRWAQQHLQACVPCTKLVGAIARALDEPDEPAVAPNRSTTGEALVDPGERIGPYLVQTELGAGAVGRVYRAADPRLDRSVALKLVHHPGVSSARVRREAQALARLSHPNVVTVLAAGDSRAGPWIAMELVEGWTLDRWTHVHAPDLAARAAALRDAAVGLHAVHAAGIVHGDLKPGNILIGQDGRVRVADFGLAKTRGGGGTLQTDDPETSRAGEPWVGGGDTTQSRHGGTPIYMAPEMLRGAAPTPRSDQFAWCVTAWELLVGTRPFSAPTITSLLDAINRGPDVEATAALPRAWSTVLRRGLLSDPAQRFDSMEALLAAWRGQASPWRRRVSALVVGVGISVVLAAALWRPTGCDDTPGPASGLLRQHAASAPDRFADPQTMRVLQAWATTWDEQAHAACLRGTEQPSRCRDDVFAEFEGRLTAVAEGSLPEAGAVSALPDAQECVDAPATAELDPATAALQRSLAAARGHYAHQKADKGRRVFARLVHDADALGAPRLQAQTRLTLARINSRLGNPVAARATYEQAYYYAVSSDEAGLAAKAAVGVARVLSFQLGRFDAAELWFANARAELSRLDDPIASCEVDLIQGEMLYIRGDFDAAEQHLYAARDHLSDDAPLRMQASVYGTVGNLEASRNRSEAAIVAFKQSVALHEQRGPKGNDDLPRPLIGLGASLAQLGRYDQAAQHWERAAALFAPDADGNEGRATLEVNLGVLRALQGDHAGAVRHYEIGCAAVQQAAADNGPEVANCFSNLALALLEVERWTDAMQAARKAIDAAYAATPPMPSRAFVGLRCTATASAALGDETTELASLRRLAQAGAEAVASGNPGDETLATDRVVDLLRLTRALVRVGADDEARQTLVQIFEALPNIADAEGRAKRQAEYDAIVAKLAAPPP